MKKRIHSLKILSTLLIAGLFLAACSYAAATPEYSRSDGGMAPAAPMVQPVGQVMEAEKAADAASTGDVANQSVDRLIIKNANLTIVAIDPLVSLENISNMAEEMGGFVVSANMYETELESGAKAPRGNVTIRVPAERLNEALKRIKAESDREPISENVSSQDVTSEYVDLGSRLHNLESAEAQLKEIMAAATKTEDVLAVYNQLVQVREQIEVIKGQMKYYEQSAALSAIAVELIANEAVQPLSIGGWQPVGVAKDAVQALINTLKFLFNALIWIVIYIAPVILVIYFVFFLPLSLLWRAWRRRRARDRQAAAAPKPLAPPEQ